MKLTYGFILLALVGLLVLWPTPEAKAQTGDTLTVEWWDGSNVIVNALVNAINNDVGRPPGRVYKLRRGGYYWNQETITANFHLRIIGEEPGTSGLEVAPAVIQMQRRANGSLEARMMTIQSDLTLKNVYILGCDENGDQTSYQPVRIEADSSHQVIDRVIFERSNFAIPAWDGKGNTILITNCVFRNLLPRADWQQWVGRGVSTWADQESVIVENCTFFNVNFTALQVESGAAKYTRFNHNTLVNIGRNFLTGTWWRKAYIANNLIINGFWHGEFSGDFGVGRDPRATYSGMIGIGALPAKYGPEEGRRILYAKNYSWRDPKFQTYYAQDNIVAAWFANPITKEDYFDVYPQMVALDTVWLDTRPNTPTYFSDSFLDSMWTHIREIRAAQGPATEYFWRLPTFQGQILWTGIHWPLLEDFSYSTPANLLTAASDGLPVGDLNWFPAQKAVFEANKDRYIAELEALAGPERTLTVVGTAEAEAGTRGGDATIVDYTGPLPYFDMDGGGFIRWVFEMPAAATVDLVIRTRSQDARRGEFVRVNGVNLRNDAGFGEYSWYDLDPVIWKPYRITASGLIEGAAGLNLTAGQNTIEIAKSWGFQEFLNVDVLVGEAVVVSLNASNVTQYDIVTLVSPGGPPPPSGFKTVQLGTSGSVTWTFNVPENGNYRLNLFYAAPAGTQAADIQVDFQTVASVQLQGTVGDSSISGVLSDAFSLTAGLQAITLSGSQVLLDYVQFIQEVTTSVLERDALPEGYALAQNYPNPFNPTTTIEFALAKPSKVKLTVYNLLGQKVATIIDNRPFSAGAHIVKFDARNLTSGVYFYRLEAGEFKSHRRMLLLK